MTIEELLVKSATAALSQQQNDGSMLPGHNGPYHDPETPVRNTSHWLISFLRSYELTGEKKFLEAAKKSLEYLLSNKARPMNATFWHRKNPKKDFSNGLMGQAWTLEALEYAYRILGYEKALKVAEEVFQLHPYKSSQKAWETINVDGSIRGFDPTFNHQLWFAAAGSLLLKYGNEKIKEPVLHFLSALPNTMKVYPDGVIMHHPKGYLLQSKKQKIKAAYKQFRTPKNQKDYTYLKSIGYHGFNLYALGIIHNDFPDLPFFSSDLLNSMINVIDTDSFRNQIMSSPYSFDYNPPGFELAFALQKFGDSSKASFFLSEDLKKSYCQERNQWGLLNPIDPLTAAARVYEAYQLSNMEMNLDE